jgi:hypothetical protein
VHKRARTQPSVGSKSFLQARQGRIQWWRRDREGYSGQWCRVIVYNIYGGEVRVGGNNGVEEGIDGVKGGGVGAYIILYIYLVSAYRPSNSPLSQSEHFIPLSFTTLLR